ncbi:16S pseudouridylate synthetase [Streptococcus pyogenes]|nr:16S pseudouridylate synthetase [Streptococcus pyogenes]
MRLDKLLEGTKVGSRSQVKKLIKAQGVWVDHMPARNGRQNVDPGLQLIEVTGQQVTHPKHSTLSSTSHQGWSQLRKILTI